jgi:hypothetical protein
MFNLLINAKMSSIIVTTPKELRAIVNEAIAEFLPKTQIKESSPDSLTLNSAIDLLKENGYPTSKAKIYKLTSLEEMPHLKYGNKLLFSRKELLQWAVDQTKRVGNHSKVALTLAKSARRKRS